jgi:HK97 family phage major capsid protein
MLLKEITEKLSEKGKLISQIYTEAGEDLDFAKVKCLEGDTTAKVDALKAIDKEVTALREERKTLLDAEKTLKEGMALNEEMNQPAKAMTHPTKGATQPQIKSLGDQFMEKKVYEHKHKDFMLDIDLKTTMTAAAGWDPPTERISRVAMYPTRALRVLDYIPMFPTGRDTIKHMQESTFTNNAAEAAEEGAYGEAALAYTEVSDEVEKVAVWLPVTDEQLEDVDGLGAWVQSRLTYMLQSRIDSQVLMGNGVSPNLLGTNSLAALQEQAKGADPTPDCIYKGMTKVRTVGYAEPSVVFINPNDWSAVRLLTTADGIYLFGSPMEAGPSQIWGVPVCQTMAVTENAAYVGDYAGQQAIFNRRGINVKITDSHAALFIAGTQAIRADVRLASVCFRISAFCKLTGI